MPNYKDFSKFKKIETIKINPNGWVNPISVEYSIEEDTLGLTCFWRVKGTEHIFEIPVKRLNYLSSGDYAKHFTEVLEIFANKEYREWKQQGFIVPWMRKYENEYKNYILI